jgi:uncharacterized repeat protein (TIGR01451 family)
VKKASYVVVLTILAAAALALAGASSAAGPRASHSGVPNSHARSPATLVTQVGQRNYAGPNCPGVGWNCTKATRVLQIATTASATNTFTCTVSPCSISQLGPAGSSNTATCSMKSTAVPTSTQSCVITQAGATNKATIAMGAEQRTGSSQTAIQTVNVTQGPATGDTSTTNSVSALEWVTQSTSAASPQTQNAYQSLVVSQTAAGAGNNTTDLHQWQVQSESNAATQFQNALGVLPAGFSDCDPAKAPSTPNACVNVTQSAGSGTNKNKIEQIVSEDQKSSAVATQTQGSATAGFEGTVHQESDPSGNSTNTATQKKFHNQNGASGSIQTQHDPVRCCGTASQLGGGGNTDTINQSASLNGNHGPVQTADLTAESVTPNGSCFISHNITMNGAGSSREMGDSPCAFFVVNTSCLASNNEGFCDEGDPIREPPDAGSPVSDLTKGVKSGSDETYSPATTMGCCNEAADYQLVYSNIGNAPATFVTVTDQLDPALSFQGCTVPEPASCFYNPDSRTVTFNLGTVNPDSSRTMFYTVTVGSSICCGETVTNIAEATTEEESEPVSSNPAVITVVGD